MNYNMVKSLIFRVLLCESSHFFLVQLLTDGSDDL